MMEFRERYNFGLYKFIARTIYRTENGKEDLFDLPGLNRIIDQVEKELLGSKGIINKKLNEYRVKLHEFCRKEFGHENSQKVSKKRIKNAFTSLKDQLDGVTTGSLKF